MKNKKQEVITLNICDFGGSFAENKDVARQIRERHLFPALKNGKKIILDYSGVNSTTQSFTHALISEAIRYFKKDFFSMVYFKNCTETVQNVVSIVSEYMQRNS